MTISFTDMFPELVEQSRRLYGTFSIIASVLVFAGLSISAANGSFGDLTRAVRGLVVAAIVVALIGIFPRLTDLLQDMGHSLVIEIGADPAESHQKFAHLIAGPETGDGGDVGFWDILWNSDNGGIGKAILYAVVLVLAKIAFAITWLATLIQNIVILLGVAVAPVFLAMFSIESTRGIAGRYLLSLVAVICWPLGWAIADIVTTGLLHMAAGNSIYSAAGDSTILAGTEILFFIVVLSLWMLASTIAAPLAITKLLVSGVQVGSSLLQGTAMSASQGLSYSIGAGVTASLGGGGTVATGAAAAAAGMGGMVSGAMGGSSVLIPAVIGTVAVMAASKEPEQEADEMAKKMSKSS
jgi:type IV secretion system protein TrbL